MYRTGTGNNYEMTEIFDNLEPKPQYGIANEIIFV
jgi:hypothetical protein